MGEGMLLKGGCARLWIGTKGEKWNRPASIRRIEYAPISPPVPRSSAGFCAPKKYLRGPSAPMNVGRPSRRREAVWIVSLVVDHLRLGLTSGRTDRSEEEGGRCSFQAERGSGHELVRIRGRAS